MGGKQYIGPILSFTSTSHWDVTCPSRPQLVVDEMLTCLLLGVFAFIIGMLCSILYVHLCCLSVKLCGRLLELVMATVTEQVLAAVVLLTVRFVYCSAQGILTTGDAKHSNNVPTILNDGPSSACKFEHAVRDYYF